MWITDQALYPTPALQETNLPPERVPARVPSTHSPYGGASAATPRPLEGLKRWLDKDLLDSAHDPKCRDLSRA